MTDLRHARLIVSGDALLTLTEAARLIGGREARAWLEAHVPVRYFAGQLVVAQPACPTQVGRGSSTSAGKLCAPDPALDAHRNAHSPTPGHSAAMGGREAR